LKRVADDARDVLARGQLVPGATEGQWLYHLPDEQLERDLYVRVNKVLAGAGGKWNRKLRAHVFNRDPSTELGLAVANGTMRDLQQEQQFYETPRATADLLVALAEPQDGEWVLEPSAGRGAIVGALVRYMASEGIRLGLDCIEREPEHYGYLCKAHERVAQRLRCQDFLETEPGVPYLDAGCGGHNVVVMNPPFTNGQDVLHVQHAATFLAQHGRLVSVMSPGWTFRNTEPFMSFRAWVQEHGGHWAELPDGTFAESGTKVRTGTLVVEL